MKVLCEVGDAVIVDEATQATEPDLLIALRHVCSQPLNPRRKPRAASMVCPLKGRGS